MHEQTDVEMRPVLGPRRAQRSRLAVLLTVIGLAGIAWAGVTGRAPANPTTADVPGPTTSPVSALPSASEASEEPYPTEALGLAVHRLDDVQLARVNRGDVLAIAGWYLPLAVTDCPPGVPSDEGSPGPDVRPGFDPWAYCERSGVLYAAQPGPGGRIAEPTLSDTVDFDGGIQAVSATLLHGVRLPASLEAAHAGPMRVVVLGHFVETSSACMLLGACPSELVVDYVAWSPQTPTS